MLLDLAGESLESARDRIAKTISEHLLQHLETHSCDPKTVPLGDELQLVVQGHIYAPQALDYDPSLPAIDLVIPVLITHLCELTGSRSISSSEISSLCREIRTEELQLVIKQINEQKNPIDYGSYSKIQVTVNFIPHIHPMW